MNSHGLFFVLTSFSRLTLTNHCQSFVHFPLLLLLHRHQDLQVPIHQRFHQFCLPTHLPQHRATIPQCRQLFFPPLSPRLPNQKTSPSHSFAFPGKQWWKCKGKAQRRWDSSELATKCSQEVVTTLKCTVLATMAPESKQNICRYTSTPMPTK